MRSLKKLLVFVGICALIGVVFAYRVKIKDFVENSTKPALPAAKTEVEILKEQAAQQPTAPVSTDKTKPVSTSKSPTTQLAEVNLKMAFQSQAPYANWAMPYAEACEEASLIMIDHFLKNTPLDTATMQKEILAMVAWEDKIFGYSKHTNAADMVRIAHEYLGYKNVTLKYNFTLDDLKAAVAAGHGVIVPAAGQLLHNPNFHVPGPIYHVLVVKGYTKDYIITNDSGTRNGADYLYTPEILMNAAHNWDPVTPITQMPNALIVISL